MLRNYFIVAFRNLLRHGAFSLVNMIGLAVGLTACLLIALYVQQEWSYDAFHEKGDRIARVIMEYGTGTEANTLIGVTGTKVAPAFVRTFPEVEAAVRIFATENIVKSEEKLFNEKHFYYADSSFFSIFSFQLIAGNPQQVLVNPNTVVISESTAKKYFGTENPIGKTLQVNDKTTFTITGVSADCPQNSQFKFDFLASFTSLSATREEETWWNANWTTFLLLKNKESFSTLQAKIAPFMKSQLPEIESDGGYLSYQLEPFTKVHLYSAVENTFEPNTNVAYLYIFSAVALLILIIACFTYMNLTTARATDRAKEVGMRKVFGAARKQLFWQFIAESAVLTGASFVISVVFTRLLLEPFNQLIGSDISFWVFFSPSNLLFILVVNNLICWQLPSAGSIWISAD